MNQQSYHIDRVRELAQNLPEPQQGEVNHIVDEEQGVVLVFMVSAQEDVKSGKIHLIHQLQGIHPIIYTHKKARRRGK